MRRFFSFAFFSLAGFAATFALYAGFGGLAAFGVLALSDGGFRAFPLLYKDFDPGLHLIALSPISF